MSTLKSKIATLFGPGNMEIEQVLIKDQARGFDLWSRFSGATHEGIIGEQRLCTLNGPIDIIP